MTGTGKSLDTSKVIYGYLSTRDSYLSNANELIEKKEYRKASELLWGAVTQSIKALAAIRNFSIDIHSQFFDFLKNLSKEIGDGEIYALFLELNSLHRNFYDEIIREDDFPIYYEKVIRFLEKVDIVSKKLISGKGT
jgi:hypothetical protein